MPTTNNAQYQREWRVNHPGYHKEYYKNNGVVGSKMVKLIRKKIDKKREAEYEYDLLTSHKTTMFAVGAAREGQDDYPYCEGEVL